MSEPTENKTKLNEENHTNDCIFKSALFIKVPSSEGFDYKRNSIDYFNTPTVTPRTSDVNFKNFISSDLMRRLEENSPIKSQNSFDINRKFSELCLVSCETKNEENDDEIISSNNQKNSIVKLENVNSGTENFNSSESNESRNDGKEVKDKVSGESENVINAMKNLKAKNFMLKTQILKPQNEYFITEEESEESSPNNTFFPKHVQAVDNNHKMNREPDSLFGNMMNFGNSNFTQPGFVSPNYNSKQTKTTRKDSSPFYSYYNDTSGYLGHNFHDEFNKNFNQDNPIPADKNYMNLNNTNNYIKKVDSYSALSKIDQNKNEQFKPQNQQQKQIYNPTYNKFNLDGNINLNAYSKTNIINHNRPQPDLKNHNFNNNFPNNGNVLNNNMYNGNKNNFTNLNNINPNKVNINQFDSTNSFQMKHSNFNKGGEEETYDDQDYIELNNKQISHNNLNNPYSIPSNLNYLNPNNLKDQELIYNYMMNKDTPNKPNTKNSSTSPNTLTNNNSNNQTTISNEEDYIVEMFGRKGWICELCNNFNYESKLNYIINLLTSFFIL